MFRNINNDLEFTDAIGHPLAINDYVTCVWSEGRVELFSIKNFVEGRHKKGGKVVDVAIELQRLPFTKAGGKNMWQGYVVPKNKIFKTPNALTWVDPTWVMMNVLRN